MDDHDPDELSADALFNHRDWAVNLARSLVGERGEPESLAQDVLTSAWARSLEKGVDLRAWLRKVLRRKAASRHRELGRRSEREKFVARGEAQQANSEITERAELHRRLVEHVLSLPEPYSVVLLQRYFEGWSPAVIARHEGCALSTISNRLTQARQALRSRLEREAAGPDWMNAYGPLLAGRTLGLKTSASSLPVGILWAAGSLALVAVMAIWFLPRSLGPQTKERAALGLDQATASVPQTALADPFGHREASAQRATRSGLAPPTSPFGTTAGDQLHGRLLLQATGRSSPLPGPAILVFAQTNDASLAAPSEDGSPPEFLFHRYTLASGGLFQPLATSGPRASANDGEWTMDVPETDLVLVQVHAAGEDWDILGDRVVPRGTARFDVLVQPYPTGELHVLDETGAPILAGLQVQSEISVPLGRSVSIQIRREERDSEKTSGQPMRRNAPVQGAQLSTLAEDAQSPIRISSRDHARQLWVSAPGYAWRKVAWPAFQTQGTVVLHPSGGLDVEVVGCDTSEAIFDLELYRDNELVLGWRGIDSNGRFEASDCHPGEHELRLKRRTSRGSIGVRQDILSIAPGEVTRTVLDLSALHAGASGSATIHVLAPKHDVLGLESIELQLHGQQAINGLAALEQSQTLAGSELAGDRRIVRFTDLVEGRYALVAAPLGARRFFDVIAGADTPVQLDLSQLAMVTVTPESQAHRIENGSALRHSLLRWKPLASPEGSEPGPTGTVVASNGGWSFACEPGPILLSAEAPDGRGIGPALRIDAVAGPNAFSISLDQARASRLEVTLDGVPPRVASEWRKTLDRALRFEQAGFPALFSKVTAAPQPAGHFTLHARVDFLDPGPYELAFDGNAELHLKGLSSSPLMIRRGEPRKLELTYREL